MKHAPRFVALVAGLLAVIAVVSTYRVFNNMYDEPATIAAGMEWLSQGSYGLEPQHPPLARVASALLPWLDGAQSHGQRHLYTEGRLILGRGEHYERVLTLARMGQLPFLLLILLTTWAWTRRLADEPTAAIAVVVAAANPNLLAHAGVAGIDIGPAALMPLGLLAWVRWLERPDARRSLLLGLTLALAGLTKFNAIAYWFPAAIAVALFIMAHDPMRFRGLAGARTFGRGTATFIATGALVTWAAYRFSVGPVGGLTLPAPEFWRGLGDFFRRGTGGHPSFLLGEVRFDGWWYFDVVTVLVKTPVPLLLFGLGGAVLVARKQRTPLALAPLFGIASVLLVTSLTRIELGVRLLLAIYPLLAILAALAARWAWVNGRRASHRFVLAAFAVWTVADPVIVHPDHIAYFNVLAGPRPERVLVDSNLDWGQDLYRLRDLTRALRTDSLRVHYFGTAEFAAVGLERARRLRPNERATGWVAASETFLAGVWSDTALHWLRAHQPVARVGRSMRLYRIPDSDLVAPSPRD